MLSIGCASFAWEVDADEEPEHEIVSKVGAICVEEMDGARADLPNRGAHILEPVHHRIELLRLEWNRGGARRSAEAFDCKSAQGWMFEK